MSQFTRNTHFGDELDESIKIGVEKVYNVAKAAYGPLSGNVLVEMNFGEPQVSHDGVSNVKRVHLEDAVENIAARIIVAASEQTNRRAGDGTTATVILSAALYNEAARLVAGGHNRMEVSRIMRDCGEKVIENLKKHTLEATKEDIRNAAKISAGEQGLGDMISAAIDEVGRDGGITVSTYDGEETRVDVEDGFFFRKGFVSDAFINNPQLRESRVSNAQIILSDKIFSDPVDLAYVLQAIVDGKPGAEFVFIGEINGEALNLLAGNTAQGIIRPTIVPPMYSGAQKTLFLNDIAAITGATVISEGTDGSAFTKEMIGHAKQVIVNPFSTVIKGGEGDIDGLLKQVREQLKNSDSQIDKDVLRDRISRLTGKIANIYVGAPTTVERDELKLRIDDAVCAVQAAGRSGILPGGATALVRASEDLGEFTQAFQKPFRDLISNSGYNAEGAIASLLGAETGEGFSVYNGLKIVDLVKEGIVDPSEVVIETVKNAVSVASKLITSSAALTYTDRTAKKD